MGEVVSACGIQGGFFSFFFSLRFCFSFPFFSFSFPFSFPSFSFLFLVLSESVLLARYLTLPYLTLPSFGSLIQREKKGLAKIKKAKMGKVFLVLLLFSFLFFSLLFFSFLFFSFLFSSYISLYFTLRFNRCASHLPAFEDLTSSFFSFVLFSFFYVGKDGADLRSQVPFIVYLTRSDLAGYQTLDGLKIR